MQKLSHTLTWIKITAGGILAIALAASPIMSPGAIAKPVKSPSAKAAARLKNHPPSGWIRHYLPDDRYKIAGNVWKVLSTQTDKYFHQADCPKMLRQSADIVIGFPSAAAALEAGYAPDPQCDPVARAAAPGAVGGSAIASVPQQLRLSDSQSTVTLPAGWRQVQSQALRNALLSANIDVFQHGRGQEGVMIATINMPAGASQTPLNAAKAREYMSMYRSSGHINSALLDVNQDLNVTDTVFKGMRGVRITPKTKTQGDSLMYMVQRGGRLYVIAAGGGKTISKDARTILNSYQPR